ncbi:MAG: helix-turn-helix transcriptional regulator, partial [Proteobacteria bacterium]|nr:helix-turn-helix transcriptional regulator [Pseudomonadota bacterium]
MIEQLNTGLACKLVLICAPAGFGKTTLLATWALSLKKNVAWISLDQSENDPALFCTYLINALQKINPEIGSVALDMLFSGKQPPANAIITILLNEIAACSQTFKVILDDYHLIENPAIHEAVILLLNHLPANMNLIISSRVAPPIALSRLRAQNELNELGAEELRFLREEATTFLNTVMGLQLSESEVRVLEDRTEGWVAGLQMAALSLKKQNNIK